MERAFDTAVYPPGYSEPKFRSVREGMTEAQVLALLGEPLRKFEGYPGLIRYYGPPGSWVGKDSGLHCPNGSSGHLIQFDLDGRIAKQGFGAGQTAEQIEAAIGKPIHEKLKRATVYWQYSRSANDGHYARRWIGFDASGRVVEKVAYFWWD